MKKLVTISIFMTFISCSMNPHVKYVRDNQKNQWIEKSHVYRSLASIHSDEEAIQKPKRK
ncbi:MAG: hypothetical protein HN576_09385 [Bacteriovoracaceae bacterium]|jgi:hypothetical protein|nr:hypothetical protein [Bacteriovoracaceae bacterium]